VQSKPVDTGYSLNHNRFPRNSLMHWNVLMSEAGDRRPAAPLTRPVSHRLRSSRDFQNCYGSGVRSGDGHLLIFAAANSCSFARSGVSVSRKHGNAVRRNRKKRLLREAFRLCQHDLPHCDFVLVPRQSARSTLLDYQSSLKKLASQLDRRLRRQSQHSQAD